MGWDSQAWPWQHPFVTTEAVSDQGVPGGFHPSDVCWQSLAEVRVSGKLLHAKPINLKCLADQIMELKIISLCTPIYAFQNVSCSSLVDLYDSLKQNKTKDPLTASAARLH